MVTGETWRLGRRPALDGVRALAVVAVVAGHAHLIAGGGVGVDVFFALSGFLITSLLLEERATHARVSLSAFYLRRLLRLAPALVTMVAGVMLLGYVLPLGSWWASATDATGALLYLTDFASTSGHTSALGHTWSLAIEEQFYLTWPLALLLLLRRYSPRQVAAVVVASVVAVLTWCAWLAQTGAADHRLGYGLDTRTAPILAGCAVALLVHQRRQVTCTRWVAPVMLAVFGTLLVAIPPLEVLFPIVTVASCGLLWSVAADRAPRWLSLGALTWIGQRSYGLYLWHYPIAVLSDWVFPAWSPGVRFAVVLAVSTAVAAVSYRFVEQPFLRRRRYAATTVIEAGPAALSVVPPIQRLAVIAVLSTRQHHFHV